MNDAAGVDALAARSTPAQSQPCRKQNRYRVQRAISQVDEGKEEGCQRNFPTKLSPGDSPRVLSPKSQPGVHITAKEKLFHASQKSNV